MYWSSASPFSAIYSAGLHGKPEDRKSAAEEIAKWFYKAAEQGHVEAQFRIGECYLHGFGAPENKEEAFRWLRKAAEKNHLEAQRRLDG